MSAFLRRTLASMHHNCQVPTSNGCLINMRRCGLMSSYSRTQRKIHPTASSAPHPPELKAVNIAGKSTGVAAAHSFYLHNLEGSHLDELLSEPNKASNCTLHRTTSNFNDETVHFLKGFNSSNIIHQSQSHQQFCLFLSSSKKVSTSFVHKRESSIRLDNRSTVHFLNNNFLQRQRQRINNNRSSGSFKNVDFIPRRHYATGPRAQKRDMSYYEVLNTTPSATQAQVKEAYFKLSKIYHPDKNAGSKEAQKKFASINEAYSVLGNLTLRKRYDRGTLNQRDVHAGVTPEESIQEEEVKRDPMYTASGVPFSVEAKRHAKNMDDFFDKHYKEALNKEQRDRAERQNRIDEYMEMQRKAKVSPIILAAFMISAIMLAVRSIQQEKMNPVPRDKKQ